MAEVKVESVKLSGTDKKGNAVFAASGTIGERKFDTMTIQWKGEPIFKVLEGGLNLSLKESGFSRGERIQIARACKEARTEKFGESHKVTVEPELAIGETVEIAASSGEEPASSMAQQRRRDRQREEIDEIRKNRNVELHPSGLPVNSSISALKRSN